MPSPERRTARRVLPPLAFGALAALLLATGGVVAHALAPAPTPTAAPAAEARADRRPAPARVAVAEPVHPRNTAAPSAYDPDERALDLRIDGLTLAEALAGVQRFARGDHPDHNRWLYRVSGFLHRHPEHCAAFAAAALVDGASPQMQALASDVLAGVGHGAAQRALRDLIDCSALGPAVRHRLLQSHLQLRTPEPAAADWLARQLDDPQVGPAAANALGAVAGRLAEAHPAAAEAAIDRLRSGLADAQDPVGQRAHLLALGNSRQAGAIAALPFADADDPQVRAAAARALRHLDDAAARDALLRLAADADARVRTRAVEELLPGLTDADLEPLLAAVRRGALGASAENSLLAAALRPEQPHRRILLDGLIEGAAQPRIRERARVALLDR